MSEQREVEIVTGTVTGVAQGVTQKGEPLWKVEVRVNPDDKYTRKLNTKSEDQARASQALIGKVASFEASGSPWKNSEGKPVTSWWINAVNPGVLPTASEGSAAVTQPHSDTSGVAAQPPSGTGSFSDPRQASIEKQVALKCAVDLAAAGYAGNAPHEITALAAHLFAFLQGTAAAVTTQENDSGNGNDRSGGATPAYDDGSDIPFRWLDRFEVQ